jgi:hypothetical protein
MEPDIRDVNWLLIDLCEKQGYSMAVREPARFMRLAADGPGRFAEAMLIAEGLDPKLEKRLLRGVREFVIARFEQWANRGTA